MTWSNVESYVAARAPKCHASFQGVAKEDLEAFESETQTVLPRAYRDFLVSCGASGGGLHPLGPGWDHDFYLLSAMPPDEEFLENKLLRVGLFTDESSLSPSDIYIEVGEDESEDTMLFSFEQDRLFDRQGLRPRGLSFLDTVVGGFFQTLQLERHELHVQLAVDTESDTKRGTMADICQEVRKVLGDLEFAEVLPASDRLSTHATPDVSAMIEGRTTASHAFVDLGSEDRRTLGRVTEVLLDHVPGLVRVGQSQPLFESV